MYYDDVTEKGNIYANNEKDLFRVKSMVTKCCE